MNVWMLVCMVLCKWLVFHPGYISRVDFPGLDSQSPQFWTCSYLTWINQCHISKGFFQLSCYCASLLPGRQHTSLGWGHMGEAGRGNTELWTVHIGNVAGQQGGERLFLVGKCTPSPWPRQRLLGRILLRHWNKILSVLPAHRLYLVSSSWPKKTVVFAPE